MRSYPRNSPEAAARLVALVLMSDGHVGRSEVEALAHADLHRSLGLPREAFSAVLQTLCEDFLAAAYASPTLIGSIDEPTLEALLAEVDDPALRLKVFNLALAAARADDHVAYGEALVIDAMRRRWDLHWGLSSGLEAGWTTRPRQPATAPA